MIQITLLIWNALLKNVTQKYDNITQKIRKRPRHKETKHGIESFCIGYYYTNENLFYELNYIKSIYEIKSLERPRHKKMITLAGITDDIDFKRTFQRSRFDLRCHTRGVLQN